MSDNRIRSYSGWHDPLIQFKAYIDFATDAPGYGPLQNETVLAAMSRSFYEEGGCLDQVIACYTTETEASNEICYNADDFCVRSPLALSAGETP